MAIIPLESAGLTDLISDLIITMHAIRTHFIMEAINPVRKYTSLSVIPVHTGAGTPTGTTDITILGMIPGTTEVIVGAGDAMAEGTAMVIEMDFTMAITGEDMVMVVMDGGAMDMETVDIMAITGTTIDHTMIMATAVVQAREEILTMVQGEVEW